MTDPLFVNMQLRAGKNAYCKPATVPPAEAAGGGFVQILAGDTVILEGAHERLRSVPLQGRASLAIVNNTINNLTFGLWFKDDLGNLYCLDTAFTITDGVSDSLDVIPPFALRENEQFILRLDSKGDPHLGGTAYAVVAYGNIWDVVAQRVDIFNISRQIVAEPPPGKMWVMDPGPDNFDMAGLFIGNGDSVQHVFDFYLGNAFTDVDILTPITVPAGQMVYSALDLGLLGIPYLYTLKAQMQEARVTAGSRILFAQTFVELNLDEGVVAVAEVPPTREQPM